MSVATPPSVARGLAPARLDHGIDLATLAGTLCELGRVARIEDLGRNGPLLASATPDSLFHCLFGRDSVRMAMDLLEDFPALARVTLLELARLQGVRRNPRSEEEPGRILHEHRRRGDRNRIKDWSFPYYGSVDSTPQWINLLWAYCTRHGGGILDELIVNRRGRRVSLRHSLRSALGWLLGRLDDPAGAGFLWVRRCGPWGLANQVWEDSGDAYYHADGVIFDFTRPYAPVAAQGYAYDALLAAADLLEDRPGPAAPRRLRERAADLRARVLSSFWQPDLGTFAPALTIEADGATRAARVPASSPGHLLASGLLDGLEAEPFREQLIVRLTRDDFVCGAGLRTKASTAPRFAPGSYHNGSSWPMDTGVIADGLRRHGRHALADDLEARILRACVAAGGFPEFFRGDEDGGLRVNTVTLDALVHGVVLRLEQPPQAYQGWTATRVWRILRRGHGR